MATTPDDVLDDANAVFATATRMDACTQMPTTLAEATTTYSVGNTAIDSGDFTPGDGDVSGRKVTVAAQNGVAVTGTGDVDFIALTDGTRIIHVADGNGQAVTSGGTMNIAAFDIEIGDPT